MSINILMPALSPTMTEGKLAKWIKNEGDAVSSGDVLAEIETDKATMEVEAVDEGILGKILVAAGTEGVAVNTPIAVLLEEGEDASALDKAPSPEIKPAAAPAAVSAATTGEAVTAPSAQRANRPTAPGGRIFASPLARRLAKEAELDLASVSGTGPRGRIVKADIEAALTSRPTPAEARPTAPVEPAAAPPTAKEAAPAKAPPPPSFASFVEVPNSTMRKVIAQRLTASKRDIPHYYLTIDCDIDRLVKLREDLNRRSQEGREEYKLSVNDFITRAVALALRAHPDVNSSWTDEALRLYQTVDVAVAVATPSGLITPVIRNADAKGLAVISNETKLLAKRAREGKLLPEEYQGGGFTVSNLGMYGIREFSAIINPPQSALLAVGAVEKRPVVRDGALAVAEVMTCTLSADHRVIDGAKGAEFLATFRRLVEDPITMLL